MRFPLPLQRTLKQAETMIPVEHARMCGAVDGPRGIDRRPQQGSVCLSHAPGLENRSTPTRLDCESFYFSRSDQWRLPVARDQMLVSADTLCLERDRMKIERS